MASVLTASLIDEPAAAGDAPAVQPVAATGQNQSTPPAPALGDALAESVAWLLVLTLLQRVLGLVRGVLFCRWLDPIELGQWDVTFAFLNLAAPLVVLGLPGSFGRYIEHYRQRGQLRSLLARTTTVCSVSLVVCLTAMLLAPGVVAGWLYGDAGQVELVYWLAGAMVGLVVHNYLGQICLGVRWHRLFNMLQFVHSVAFAAIGLGLLALLKPDVREVILGFAAACVVAIAFALVRMRRLPGEETHAPTAACRDSLWRKLLPFAVWIWITNILANLFEVADRMLIVHASGLDAATALQTVGQYHAARLVPLLFVAVTGMIGAMVTPHLSHDWEAGRRDAVARRLNTVLKLVALGQLLMAAAVLIAAPVLFEVAFKGRFVRGLAVLPWVLVYCSWFGLFAVAQNYLWCAEKARLSTLSLLVGLSINVGANLILLPHFGLIGAVWATTLANAVALSLVLWFSRQAGMRVDRGVPLAIGLVAAVGLGEVAALGAIAVAAMLLVRGDALLDGLEKEQLTAALASLTRRLPRLRGRRPQQQAAL